MTNQPEPGIYEGVPYDEYHAWPCFSKSMISATMKSAKHLKQYLMDDNQTKAKTIGSIVDALLLEPDEISKFQAVPLTYINSKKKRSPWNKQSKTCRQYEDDLNKSGITPIKVADLDTAYLMADSVESNKTARALLSGKKQVAVVWDNEEFGVRCKGRLDILNKGSIDDLKTSRNIFPFWFGRDIVNLGYHCQAAMYLDGTYANDKIDRIWNFITVENQAPFDTVVYNLDDESIQAGRIRYRMALKRYRSYVDNDPELLNGYSNFVEPISVPEWEIEKSLKEGFDAGI